MKELILKRDELVYVGRPHGYFGRIVKVHENSMVEVKHYTGKNYEKTEFAMVHADLIRDISNVGYKEPTKDDQTKVKRSVFKKKTFNKTDLDSVLKDLQ